MRRAGFEVLRIDSPAAPPQLLDIDPSVQRIIDQVRGFTLTSAARINALCEAVRYVVRADIPGALVECGVWRGGSMMAVAHMLLELGQVDRDLYLFDTFDHMPRPTEHDRTIHGIDGAALWDLSDELQAFPYLPFEEVKAALVTTGYPAERLHFVRGLVEDTLPAQRPDVIALCRLDTDWYESTAHEMATLVPHISPGGILLIDDYGEFLGARKAVDDYLSATDLLLLLHRIDLSGRIAVMPGLPDRRIPSTG
jgi:O-methyltransferase